MRLLPRLLLTQALPLLLMTGAVGVVFAGSGSVTALLSDMERGELRALRDETSLHRVGWTLDVSMRRAEKDCRAGHEDRALAAAVVAHASTLRQALSEVPIADRQLLDVLGSYVALADQVDLDAPCGVLGRFEHEARREVLDEDLTNAWVARIARLHEDVVVREAEAQSVIRASIARGVTLIVLALVLAVVVCWRLARTVSTSMAELAATARRLGRQEFEAPVAPVDGPAEVGELAVELESLREKLAEVDVLKRGFVASVSHEMRTPLSKMREALALLADGAGGALVARQTRLVQIARDACERQIRTVSALLDLSRLRAGAAIQREAGASLAPILKHAVDEERTDAEARGVRVELTLPECSPTGSFDVPLVERAVANLVRNAVSVSRSGQRVVVDCSVEAVGPSGKGPCARILVRDEGPGIPPELRDNIFQPFVSSAVPQSPKALGVGLGLSLCNEVAAAHGGVLELLAPEHGAELCLWLPIDGARTTRSRAEET